VYIFKKNAARRSRLNKAAKWRNYSARLKIGKCISERKNIRLHGPPTIRKKLIGKSMLYTTSKQRQTIHHPLFAPFHLDDSPPKARPNIDTGLYCRAASKQNMQQSFHGVEIPAALL
jgi:hypothetical protein